LKTDARTGYPKAKKSEVKV